jgi:hypothetical protein
VARKEQQVQTAQNCYQYHQGFSMHAGDKVPTIPAVLHVAKNEITTMVPLSIA